MLLHCFLQRLWVRFCDLPLLVSADFRHSLTFGHISASIFTSLPIVCLLCGFLFFKNYFIYLFVSVLGLYRCMKAFSSFSSFELLIAVASLVEECRLLSAWAWVAVAHGLSYSVAHRIFPDQISNPCQILNHWTTRAVPYVSYKNTCHWV